MNIKDKVNLLRGYLQSNKGEKLTRLIDLVEIPTKKEDRLKANKEAEALIKRLEVGELNLEELTIEDKKRLLKFTGYGGLGGIDNDEYFTPKEVAKGAWKLLSPEPKDNILDPSTGVGIFSQTANEDVFIEGCDLNPISGQIADIVNDNSDVKAGISFEEFSASKEPNSYDGIITNVPFGRRDKKIASADKDFLDIKRNEDYFILKSLQLLKQGKRAVFLTTSSTAQRKNKDRKEIRQKFSDYGSFIGGIRLPSAMFKDTGTEQVVDILVFEKHPNKIVKALENNTIDFESWQEALYYSKTNKDFIDGVYFDNRPENIIGTFKSKEDFEKEALEKGENLHHMAQRDYVELPENTTIEQVKQNFDKYLKHFENDIDYSKVKINGVEIDSASNSTDDKLIEQYKEDVYQELEYIKNGNISKLMPYSEFAKKVDFLHTHLERFSKIDESYIYARKWAFESGYYDFLMLFMFGKVDSEFIKENKETIEKILKNKPLPHTHNSIVVAKWNELSKYNLETGEYIKDITEEISNKNNVFKNKKYKIENYQKVFNVNDFNNDELLDDEVLIVDGKVYELEDFLIDNNGENYDVLVDKIKNTKNNTSLSDADFVQKIDRQIELLKNYIDEIDADSFKVPLSMITEIFSSTDVTYIVDTAKSLDSIKKQARLNSIEALNKNELFQGKGKEVYDSVINRFQAYNNFIEHLIYKESLRLFDRDIWLRVVEIPKGKTEEEIISVAKLIIREQYYRLKAVVETFINNKIHSEKRLREVLEKFLKEARKIKYDIDGENERLSELTGIVKNEWLDKARHYQNADTRKFSREMQGIVAYDTGLGKASTAVFIAMKMLERTTARRVIYTVPNAIFGSIKNEVESVLTDKMLEKTLFIDSKNSNLFNKLKTDKNIEFIVTPHSTMISQLRLKDETVKLLWGGNNKEENTNSDEEDKYPPNELKNWIDYYPKYKDTAVHFFEDLGIDAIIMDEAHHHKNAVATAKAGVKGLNAKSSNEAVIITSFIEYIKGIKRGDMKGCVLTTATPATSSPTEIETMLLMATDRKAMKSYGIKSKQSFEDLFFRIEKKTVLKTDGVSYTEKDVLVGLHNLSLMYKIGLDKILYREAEKEEAVAKQFGQTIVVKPSNEEKDTTINLDSVSQDIMQKLTMLNKKYSQFVRNINDGQEEINEDNVYEVIVAKEIGEIFGYMSRANYVAISKEYALNTVKVRLNKDYTEDDVLKVIGDKKVFYKEAILREDKYGNTMLTIKNSPIALKDYYNTAYYKERVKVYGELIKPLKENEFLYIPTTDYDKLKTILNALNKAKMIDNPFDAKDYPKLASVLENIKQEQKRHPKAKQIIYSTSLATHHILDYMIKTYIPECKKIWHFNNNALKNADAKLKVQEEFNSFKDFGIMIFGRAGEVGVNFNKYVSAVHLVDIGQTPDARHQAKGRAVRQGNNIDKVYVYNYFANGTFDVFLAELVSNKSNWIEALKDASMNEVSYDDNSQEALLAEAQRRYGHLDISVDEKVRMLLEDYKKEKEEFAKLQKATLVDAQLKDISKFKSFIEEYDRYSLEDFLEDLGARSWYPKIPSPDTFEDDELTFKEFAKIFEVDKIKVANTLLKKDEIKTIYEEVSGGYLFGLIKDKVNSTDKKLIELYNDKDTSENKKSLIEKIAKKNNTEIGKIFTTIIRKICDILEIEYNNKVYSLKNKDKVLNDMYFELYGNIDTENDFETFKSNISLLEFKDGTYTMPKVTKLDTPIKIKSGRYVEYKGVCKYFGFDEKRDEIVDSELKDYELITSVEALNKYLKKEVGDNKAKRILKFIEEVDERGSENILKEFKLQKEAEEQERLEKEKMQKLEEEAKKKAKEEAEKNTVYVIERGYVVFKYLENEKLVFSKKGKITITDSKYPFNTSAAKAYTIRELEDSDVKFKNEILEFIKGES